MTYYKLLIHAWFDWDSSESDLEEIGKACGCSRRRYALRGKSSPSLTSRRIFRTRK
jgi:hypothetical protein